MNQTTRTHAPVTNDEAQALLALTDDIIRRNYDALPKDAKLLATRVLARKWRQWEAFDEFGDYRQEAANILVAQAREIIVDAKDGLDIATASTAEIYEVELRRSRARWANLMRQVKGGAAITGKKGYQLMCYWERIQRLEEFLAQEKNGSPHGFLNARRAAPR